MTTPTTTKIELPPPGYPVLTRMISHDPLPEETATKPLVWVLGELHPLMSDYRVVRMFVVDRGGVEVYAVSLDGRRAFRNLIPMTSIRIVEETMPLDVLADELEAAESSGDDEEDYGEEDPEPIPSPVAEADTEPNPDQSNGQIASS
jgi:hypothetical protein